MRYNSLISLVLSIAFVTGCASRYKAFTLVEGSGDETTSSSSTTSSDPKLHELVQENTDSELQIKRQVLVDRKTGKIYYFDGLSGPLKTFSESN